MAKIWRFHKVNLEKILLRQMDDALDSVVSNDQGGKLGPWSALNNSSWGGPRSKPTKTTSIKIDFEFSRRLLVNNRAERVRSLTTIAGIRKVVRNWVPHAIHSENSHDKEETETGRQQRFETHAPSPPFPKLLIFIPNAHFLSLFFHFRPSTFFRSNFVFKL